jgi:hypothetical protein
VSNRKVRVSQKSDPSKPQVILNTDSASTFSEDAIRPALTKSTSLAAASTTVLTRIGARRSPN